MFLRELEGLRVNVPKSKLDPRVAEALRLLEEAGASIKDLIEAGYQPSREDALDVVTALVDTPLEPRVQQAMLGHNIALRPGAIERHEISTAIQTAINRVRLMRLGINPDAEPGFHDAPHETLFGERSKNLIKSMHTLDDPHLNDGPKSIEKVTLPKIYEEKPLPESFIDWDAGKGPDSRPFRDL